MKTIMSRLHRRPIIRYGVAVLLVAIAALATVLMRRVFPSTPNSLFFCAVILSAWLGGWGPGMAAGILSAGLSVYWLPPPSVVDQSPASTIPRLIIFLFAS